MDADCTMGMFGQEVTMQMAINVNECMDGEMVSCLEDGSVHFGSYDKDCTGEADESMSGKLGECSHNCAGGMCFYIKFESEDAICGTAGMNQQTIIIYGAVSGAVLFLICAVLMMYLYARICCFCCFSASNNKEGEVTKTEV